MTLQEQRSKLHENFEKLYEKHNLTEEQKEKVVDNFIDLINQRKSNVDYISENFDKIIFITTNPIRSDKDKITSLSISKYMVNNDFNMKYPDFDCFDRYYLCNKKDNYESLLLRENSKANYAEYYNDDKKDVYKFIGKLDNKTLVVCLNMNARQKFFKKIIESDAVIFDVAFDTCWAFNTHQAGLYPLLNHLKVTFHEELIKRTYYENEVMMNAFYNFVYFYGIQDFENKKIDWIQRYEEAKKIALEEIREEELESIRNKASEENIESFKEMSEELVAMVNNYQFTHDIELKIEEII